jgi:hypothetical protein
MAVQHALPIGPATQPTTGCTVWSDFAAVRANSLGARLAEPQQSVFETLEWFDNLANTCPVLGSEVVLLSVDQPTGATLLALRRWSGGKVESLSNYYGALFGPVTTDIAVAARDAAVIAEWLSRSGACTIRLHPLSHDATFWDAFTAGLRRCGYWVDQYYVFANWYHPCQGVCWADYLAARPSRLRNTIVRTQKKLQADPGFSLRITHAASDQAHVEQAILDFCKVYARSWKKPEPFPLFVPGLCRFAHSKGWLRLGVGYLGGEPVAAQIWIVKSGAASIFKLAYDDRYAKRGVGTFMSAALTEYVLDVDHVTEIDFLAGDDSYKSEWMDCRRERFGIVAYQPRTIRGLLAGCLHFGARIMRRLVPIRQSVTGRESKE